MSSFDPSLMSKLRPVEMKWRLQHRQGEAWQQPVPPSLLLTPGLLLWFSWAACGRGFSSRVTTTLNIGVKQLQSGQSRFKIFKVRQAGTAMRGGDFNRCRQGIEQPARRCAKRARRGRDESEVAACPHTNVCIFVLSACTKYILLRSWWNNK